MMMMDGLDDCMVYEDLHWHPGGVGLVGLVAVHHISPCVR